MSFTLPRSQLVRKRGGRDSRRETGLSHELTTGSSEAELSFKNLPAELYYSILREETDNSFEATYVEQRYEEITELCFNCVAPTCTV